MKKSAIKRMTLISICLVLTLCCVMCKRNTTSDFLSGSNNSLEVDSISDNGSDDIDTAIIFATKVHVDERLAIKELEEAGLLKCDTIEERNGQFAGAIVEFASVKFGLNKGFLFLTSRQDKQAIDSLVNRISKYYGEPFIDDGDVLGELERCYYHWNLHETDADKPYIRIRPLHSDDGGLVMTWILKN